MSELCAYRQIGDDPQTLIHHEHDCHELILVESGRSTFTIENRVYTVKPRSLVVIGHLERHHVRIDQTPYHRQIMLIPNSFLIHEIKTPLLASFFLYRPKGFSHMLPLSDAMFAVLREHFSNIIGEYQQGLPLKDTRLGLMLDMLLIDLYRGMRECFSWENTQDMAIVFEVQRHVAQHYTERLTLADMAERFHISRYHLSRRFQAITGYGFQRYLTVCRLNRAKQLLLTTDLPVTGVSEGSGYGDVNHFIRTFRDHEGVTPLQYRKRMASEAEMLYGLPH